MKRFCLIFLFCTILADTIVAQYGNGLFFKESVYDYGTISEDGGNKTAHFTFVNTGKVAIAVTRVATTCGCAVPEYTKSPVQPGKQGEISVVYKPQGRVGIFERSIAVYTTQNKERITLKIKGRVEAGVPRKHKDYPHVMGPLQLKNRELFFNYSVLKQQRIQSIVVINSGSEPLSLDFKTGNTDLTAALEPAVLAPDQEGEIVVTYRPTIKKAASFQERIELQFKEGHLQKDASILVNIKMR